MKPMLNACPDNFGEMELNAPAALYAFFIPENAFLYTCPAPAKRSQKDVGFFTG
jgi:hypothetical protein